MCKDLSGLIFASYMDVVWAKFIQMVTDDLRLTHTIDLQTMENRKHPYKGRGGAYRYPSPTAVHNLAVNMAAATERLTSDLQELESRGRNSRVIAHYWGDSSALKMMIQKEQGLRGEVRRNLREAKKQIIHTYHDTCNWVKEALYQLFYILSFLVMIFIVSSVTNTRKSEDWR